MRITNADPRTAREYFSAAYESWLHGLRLGFNAILEAGRLLLEAKTRTPHGEFLHALENGPMHPRTAQKLMAIASHPVLANTKNSSLLPPHSETLYELTKLPEPVLETAIAEGKITPELERHQVKKLWGAAPESERPAPDYEIFHCEWCGAYKLVRDETRPSSLGENEERKPRLYDCAECGKTTLTWEQSGGRFAKKSLPKSSKDPLDGTRVTVELPAPPQTSTR